MIPADQAARFVRCLDIRDFSSASQYLHAQCEYAIGLDTITGPLAICDYWELNDLRHQCTHVESTSVLETISDTIYKARHTTLLGRSGQNHTFEYEQTLHFAEGLIARIIHVDLPGEREDLETFLQK